MPTPSERGVTLIETLLALALLVLIAAVALPSLVRTLGVAERDETARQIDAAVLIASLQAQRSGDLVRLSLGQQSGRYVLLSQTLRPDQTDGPPVPVGASRVVLTLPRAMAWSVAPELEEPPTQGAATSFDQDIAPADIAVDDAERAGPVLVLATFLPDGHAAPGPSLLVTARDERSATVLVTRYPPAVSWKWHEQGTPQEFAEPEDNPLGAVR